MRFLVCWLGIALAAVTWWWLSEPSSPGGPAIEVDRFASLGPALASLERESCGGGSPSLVADLSEWTWDRGTPKSGAVDVGMVAECSDNCLAVAPEDWRVQAEQFNRARIVFDSDVFDETGQLPMLRLQWRSSVAGGGQRAIRLPTTERHQVEVPLNQADSWVGELSRFRVSFMTRQQRTVRLERVELLNELHDLRITGSGWGEVLVGRTYRPSYFSACDISDTLSIDSTSDLRLHFGVATMGTLSPARFAVVRDDGEERETVFEEHIAPGEWRDRVVDIDGGGRFTLTFVVEHGEGGGVAAWSDPILRPRAAATDLPDVFLYLVDTLRADHLPIYGYNRVSTPALSELAASGVVFERCMAPSNHTLPSTVSLMTSTYPAQHGYDHSTASPPIDFPTLAESMRAAGYRTGAFITNSNAGHYASLHRGYSTFVDASRNHNEDLDARLSLPHEALSWIERHRHEPLFVYVHTAEPHAPYDPPERFRLPSDYDGPIDGRNYRKRAKTPAEIAQVVRLYDGEIQFMDASLSAFLDTLRTLGNLEPSLVLFTSDHGELFSQHGKWGHGSHLYKGVVHVPLVAKLPGNVSAGERVARPVRSIDIAPTVLSLAGLARPASMHGVPLLGSSAEVLPDFVVSQERDRWRDRDALIGWRWSVVRETQRGKRAPLQMYSMVGVGEAYEGEVADPELRQLLAAAEQWQSPSSTGRPTAGSRAIDAESLEQMRRLGYLDAE